MPTTRFIPYTDAIQYDGTNSAEILALIPDYLDNGPPGIPAGIASEVDGVLTLELVDQSYGPFNHVANVGDWVTFPQKFPYGHAGAGLSGVIIYPAVEGGGMVPLDHMYALASEYEAPEPQVLHVAVGKAALPALLLGGTTSPVVVFDTPMPDANYDLKWRAVSGAAVLASIVANGAVTKTASQVTIPLKAQGLASVAGVLLVEAFKLADA